METFAPLTKAERRERFMHKTRAEAGYVFKYLILTQIIVYLEAGAIPCLLDQLSVSLNLDATQQGALGGVVYLALSAASPLCAYFLHRFNPRIVLGLSLLCNNVAVLMLALTPTGYSYSANMLILARAAVGFTQAFPCIYTPLWVDERGAGPFCCSF
uniref:Major facilitator superfamily (MFS) profile domain-containing protein n=1 Tax=Hyaloperonospora arabidopsidis (strain Emoy2) TaxID=559515 RepID=M4BYL4_HYAAE